MVKVDGGAGDGYTKVTLRSNFFIFIYLFFIYITHILRDKWGFVTNNQGIVIPIIYSILLRL